MKRALAVCTVLAVLGFSAFGIGTFSGKWETKINVLPTLSLSYTNLTLNYSDFGWTFTGLFKFLSTGLDSVKITAKGALGPFSLTGNMWFDAAPTPAPMGSDLTTSLDIAGLSLGFTVRHWNKDYASYFFGPSGKPWSPDEEPCQTYEGQAGMMYIISTKIDPISLKVRFVDCSSGIEFYDAVINLSGIGLCCGISLNAELAFSKEDLFEYLKITGIEIPLCCGVSLTAGVTFTTNGKALDTGFKFAGFGDTCFTVYADATHTGYAWTGIEIYGYKIKCSLGDCNYVEFLTAFNVAKVEEILGSDIFSGDEFEYMKLGFCGTSCCGPKYTVALSVYFQESGSLFGITRIGADMSIPIMDNLTVKVSFTSAPTLAVTWTFTF